MKKEKQEFDEQVFYKLYNKTTMETLYHILSYIKSCGKSLPKDITTFLFQQYDDEKLNGVPLIQSVPRAILIEANIGLIYHTTNALNLNLQDSKFEEYLMTGKIGLVKAVDNFDKDKGCLFSSFAIRVIENEIKMYLRHLNSTAKTVCLDDALYLDKDGNELKLIDVLEDENEDFYILNNLDVMKENLQNIMKYIKPNQQLVLSLSFGLNGQKQHTQREVAEMLNVCQPAISRIQKHTLGKLKTIINDYTSLNKKNFESLYKSYPLLSKKDIVEILQNCKANNYKNHPDNELQIKQA